MCHPAGPFSFDLTYGRKHRLWPKTNRSNSRFAKELQSVDGIWNSMLETRLGVSLSDVGKKIANL